jgi:hypothetical protein
MVLLELPGGSTNAELILLVPSRSLSHFLLRRNVDRTCALVILFLLSFLRQLAAESRKVEGETKSRTISSQQHPFSARVRPLVRDVLSFRLFPSSLVTFLPFCVQGASFGCRHCELGRTTSMLHHFEATFSFQTNHRVRFVSPLFDVSSEIELEWEIDDTKIRI